MITDCCRLLSIVADWLPIGCRRHRRPCRLFPPPLPPFVRRRSFAAAVAAVPAPMTAVVTAVVILITIQPVSAHKNASNRNRTGLPIAVDSGQSTRSPRPS